MLEEAATQWSSDPPRGCANSISRATSCQYLLPQQNHIYTAWKLGALLATIHVLCCVVRHWCMCNPRILNVPTGYQILSRPFVNTFPVLCRKWASSFQIYLNDIFVLSKNLCSCLIKSSGQLTASSVLQAYAFINKFCLSVKITPSRDSWETAI